MKNTVQTQQRPQGSLSVGAKKQYPDRITTKKRKRVVPSLFLASFRTPRERERELWLLQVVVYVCAVVAFRLLWFYLLFVVAVLLLVVVDAVLVAKLKFSKQKRPKFKDLFLNV